MSEPDAAETAAMFERKRTWHREQTKLPLPVKFRILIELQRQELPLLARQRALRPWERPWEITP